MGKRILFVCSFGQNRSRTGAELWKAYHPEDTVYHTGILKGEDLKTLIDWADHIYVMEEEHKEELLKFRLEAEKKITVLDVVNIFGFGDESLTEQLKRKLALD